MEGSVKNEIYSPNKLQIIQHLFLAVIALITAILLILNGINNIANAKSENILLIVVIPVVMGIGVLIIGINIVMKVFNSEILFSEQGIRKAVKFRSTMVLWTEIEGVRVIYYYWSSEGKKSKEIAKIIINLKNERELVLELAYYTKKQRIAIKKSIEFYYKRIYDKKIQIEYQERIRSYNY